MLNHKFVLWTDFGLRRMTEITNYGIYYIQFILSFVALFFWEIELSDS